jgi:acylphosphatase
VIGAWFRVEGHVQGVGFRAFVRDIAESLGLRGEVWNTRDRAVEGCVFGPEELLEDFILRLRSGPGRVDRVSTQPLPRSDFPEGFHVGYTR